MPRPDGPDTHEGAWTSGRNAGLDAGRAVAAACVVFVHTNAAVMLEGIAYSQIGYVGVPFFAAAAVVFMVRRVFNGVGSAAIVSMSVRRLLRPFAIWSAIYFIVRYVLSGWIVNGVAPRVSWTDVLHGAGGWHLWFLPFILCVGLAAMVAAKVAARSVAATGVIIGLSLVSAGLLVGLHTSSPESVARNVLVRWPFELPVALVALAVGLSIERRWLVLPRRGRVSAAFWCCFVLLVACGTIVSDDGSRRLAQAAGVAMLLACLTWPTVRVPSWLVHLGSMGFGVYVVHYLFQLASSRVVDGDGVVTPAEGLAAFFLTLIGSFVAVWVLERIPVARRLLP
ncbi:MAG: acyltransferase [Planctomycetota bacterium]